MASAQEGLGRRDCRDSDARDYLPDGTAWPLHAFALTADGTRTINYHRIIEKGTLALRGTDIIKVATGTCRHRGGIWPDENGRLLYGPDDHPSESPEERVLQRLFPGKVYGAWVDYPLEDVVTAAIVDLDR